MLTVSKKLHFYWQLTLIDLKLEICLTHHILIIKSYYISQKMLIVISEYLILCSYPLSLLLL
jgi:hypothetical protein